ncbi:MAG: glycosyltransferase family 4 protein [Clostridia bacterium]|nr:glycosyltransferase family 4 protein [Clostridia bacterium]
MKKKILIIANFTKLPWEQGNSRFPYIINLIDKEKYEVELVTSSFSHGDKKQREDKSDESKLDYKITLIHEPGYKKNVSLKRFYSHHVFAKNVEKHLGNIEKPDIIYCAVPSLDVAKVAAKYAENNDIKFVIDIQDLWPEAFKMVFNIPVISSIIFYPMKKTADYIYSKANSIVAVSKTYANRAAIVNKKFDKKISVYLGTELENFDKTRDANPISHNDDVVRVAYIGTLGSSYDIKCVIDAIKILNNKGIKNILFVVMGSGPLQEEFEAYSKEQKVNCDFTGTLAYDEMIGRLCACEIAVNPIRKGSAGSIINKVGDYAAAGLPVVNTQESPEYRKLVEDYQIGFNVETSNAEEMAEKIELLYKDKALRKRLGKNNRKLAEEKFDRKHTYKEIKKIIEV